MKRLCFFVMSCVFSINSSLAFDSCSRSLFVPRAQQTNVVRRTDFFQDRINQEDTCYSFLFTPEITRSFRACKIAQNFFGSNRLNFSGSKVSERGEKDILADYLGLPNDFQGSACFSPVITNFLIDSALCVDLSWLHEDLYLKFYAPFVHTRWDMRLNQNVEQEGTAESPAGYLSRGNKPLTINQLTTDIVTAFNGEATFGDMQDPMRFGKIDCKQKKTELAELRTQLFWDFSKKEDSRFALSVMLSAPTGTRRASEYLFEPIVGNGHHWELGFGLHGVWQFWKDEAEEKNCGMLIDLNFSHLFRASQVRSFDLKEYGPGIRYMLLSSLDAVRDDILQVPQNVFPAQQYTGHLFPAINKTSLKCEVSVGLQADMLLAFSYKKELWRFDVGYNLWMRSKEKIKCREKFKDDRFAPKGDAQLYGYWDESSYTGEGPFYVSFPLNVTQSESTIYNGQPDLNGNFNTNYTNSNSDNPAIAYETFSGTPLELFVYGTADEINGSNQAILLTDEAIDECSALSPRASSSKLFVACNYACESKEKWDPFVGAGFEIEFGHSRYALSQIGIWLMFGLSY